MTNKWESIILWPNETNHQRISCLIMINRKNNIIMHCIKMDFYEHLTKSIIKFTRISCCCIREAQSQRQCWGQSASVMSVFSRLCLFDSINLKSRYMLIFLMCTQVLLVKHQRQCWQQAQGCARTFVHVLYLKFIPHTQCSTSSLSNSWWNLY